MTKWSDVENAGDLADWRDTQKRDSYALLREFSYAHKDNIVLFYGPRVLAIPYMVAAEFGTGFVDLARLGEGFAKGGVGRYGHDALRLLTFLGGVPRLLRIAKFASVQRLMDPLRRYQ